MAHKPAGNLEDLLKGTQVLTSQQVDVYSWSPEPVEANIPATEVHLVCSAFRYPGMKFIIRLGSRRFCEELIAAITLHMNEIWPKGN